MATVKVTTFISQFSSLKMIVFALMASFILAVLVHLSMRDFHAVSTAAQKWSPGYGKGLPKVPFLQKSGKLGKGVELGLKRPSGRRQRLPTCLIIGFANHGARVLREILSIHPGIVAADREVKYFTENYQRGQTWYRQQMPLSLLSQTTVEETQNYILSSQALTRIFRFNANLKMIAVVQDPVNRLLSTYIRQTSSQAPNQPTFKEWCGYIHNTPKILQLINYEAPIRDVYSHFPTKNLLVLSKEDVEFRPMQTLHAVEKFLGLRIGLSDSEFVHNPVTGGNCFDTHGPRYPQIKAMLTPGTVLDLDSGCLVNAGNMPSVPGVRADPDFFQKVVGVIQKSNVRFFHLVGKTFDWTTNYKLALQRQSS